MIAPSTPGGCFDAAFEAARIAIRYRTPVIVLSDTFLASSSEPWRIPDVADLPAIDPNFATARTASEFQPYARDERLARPWAIPGTPGLQHRIGGLEKADGSGNISYDGANHERMTELRAAKVDRHRRRAAAADRRLRARGQPAGARAGARPRARSAPACGARARPAARSPAPSCATSTRCRPTPGDVLRSFERVLVPEMNSGQLAQVLRAPLPGRRRVLLQGPGPAAVRGEIEDAIAARQMSATQRQHGARTSDARPTSSPTRRPAGARAAATTRSSRRSSSSCPSWGSRPSGSCSSPGSAAPGASPTTWTPTGCTASTAARRRSPPVWPPPARTSRSGS